MRSRWGAIANPHAKVFDPTSIHVVPPLGHDPSNRIKFCSICYQYFICKNAHKVWHKNLRIDPLTSPKVTSLTLG